MYSWDLFCRVIDNYGDIGVCWRLARQLAAECRQKKIRLWVDDIAALRKILPQAELQDYQHVDGVDVCTWKEVFDARIQPADVVIEAFGCDLPPSYLANMQAQNLSSNAALHARQTVWINLEYLSAESWVEDCHQVSSHHGPTGLKRIFFFPGFRGKTGGLIRERGLLHRREVFDKQTWLNQLGALAGLQQASLGNNFLISLFAYENTGIGALLDTWAKSCSPLTCLVPVGKILNSLHSVSGIQLRVGEPYALGKLTLQAIPFLTQSDYDHLLWACDLNFVRGEDSLVRGLWAAQPLVWQLYPQAENAHLQKMDAFLQRVYLAEAGAQLAPALNQLWQGWNRPAVASEGASAVGEAWEAAMRHWPQWHGLARGCAIKLGQSSDLATSLIDFVNRQTGLGRSNAGRQAPPK